MGFLAICIQTSGFMPKGAGSASKEELKQSKHKTVGACRGNTRLTRMIPRDAERYALIARGCMMRWTDATTSTHMYTCGITDCFRSVRAFRCRAASASTGQRGQRGGVAGAPAECPDHYAPLARKRLYGKARRASR